MTFFACGARIACESLPKNLLVIVALVLVVVVVVVVDAPAKRPKTREDLNRRAQRSQRKSA